MTKTFSNPNFSSCFSSPLRRDHPVPSGSDPVHHPVCLVSVRGVHVLVCVLVRVPTSHVCASPVPQHNKVVVTEAEEIRFAKKIEHIFEVVDL